MTALDSNRTWTWQNRSPGADTVARHTLTPTADDRTHVDLFIDQRGFIGRPIGWVLKRVTRRYLRLEAEGLRRRSEAFKPRAHKSQRSIPPTDKV